MNRQILRQKFGLFRLPTATQLLSELGLGRGRRLTNALGLRRPNPLNPVLDVALGLTTSNRVCYNGVFGKRYRTRTACVRQSAGELGSKNSGNLSVWKSAANRDYK